MNACKTFSFSSSTQRMPTLSAYLSSALCDSLALMGLRNSLPPPPPHPDQPSYHLQHRETAAESYQCIEQRSVVSTNLAENLKGVSETEVVFDITDWLSASSRKDELSALT